MAAGASGPSLSAHLPRARAGRAAPTWPRRIEGGMLWADCRAAGPAETRQRRCTRRNRRCTLVR